MSDQKTQIDVEQDALKRYQKAHKPEDVLDRPFTEHDDYKPLVEGPPRQSKIELQEFENGGPTVLQRSMFMEWIAKWRTRLFLDKWYIDVDYMVNERDPSLKPGFIAHLDINVTEEYFTAHIRVYPAFWELDEKRQEYSVVHELCHCLTEAAFDCVENLLDGKLVTLHEARTENERLTETIAAIVFKGEWVK